LFSILGAVALILVVALGVFFHVRSEDDGATAAPRPTNAATVSSSPQAPPAAVPSETVVPPPPSEAEPKIAIRTGETHNPSKHKTPVPPPTPAVVTGEALIDSTPTGAPFQVDGKSDPAWVTPFNVRELSAGKHIISVSKAGYSAEIRSVDVDAGNKASLMLHLTPINALMVVSSTPAGASVILDGKPTGRVTPAQFAVEKGSHTLLLHKEGYVDETASADLGPAQNFQYAPMLKALGNTEDMRTVGKLGGLFGRGGDSAAGKGSIVIRTQPKGAQVAINQHLLDKASPVGVVVGAGTYIVDITLTGFKTVHKVVNVGKGDKTAVIETLEPQ